MVERQLGIGRIDLVRDEQVGHRVALQDSCDADVIVTNLSRCVRHEHDEVGPPRGDLGLLLDVGRQLLTGSELPAAGINDRERPPLPFGVELSSIPRHTGLFVDDGRLAPHDPVHQGRLADIGATEHRDDRNRTHHATAARRPEAFAVATRSGALAAAATSASGTSSRKRSPERATSGST